MNCLRQFHKHFSLQLTAIVWVDGEDTSTLCKFCSPHRLHILPLIIDNASYTIILFKIVTFFHDDVFIQQHTKWNQGENPQGKDGLI